MKSNEKKAKNLLMRVVTAVATKSAVQNANSACPWWGHQPKTTEAVKKLRKF